MMKKFWIKICALDLLFLSILVIFDQYTKQWMQQHIQNNKITVIKDVFSFTYSTNTGAAWGIFAGKTNYFIVLCTILVCLLGGLTVRCIWLYTHHKEQLSYGRKLLWLQSLCILLIAGAIGNLIDRVSLGYVIDFLYFELINFPIFNVADCYVTVGGMLVVIFTMFIFTEDEFNAIISKKGLK